jgi:hypothetical protein
MTILTLIIGLLLSSPYNQTNNCSEFPFKQLLKGPPKARYEYRALYVNKAYQYSIVIPKGLTAYDGRSEPNHQGFGIALDDSLQSFIFVRGENNSLGHDTAHEAAKQDAKYLQQAGKKIESETISKSNLGALDAVQLVVTYTCSGSSDRHIQSSVMALSPDKRFLYTIELDSPTNRYDQYQAVLAQVIKSWKPIPQAQRQPRK